MNNALDRFDRKRNFEIIHHLDPPEPVRGHQKEIADCAGNNWRSIRRQLGPMCRHPCAPIAHRLSFENGASAAVDRMLDEAGLTIYPYTEGGRVGLVARDDNLPNRAGAATYAGAFRIEPISTT